MYVGLEADGTLVGYYDEGASRPDEFYYTLLDGWNCDWNYVDVCNSSISECADDCSKDEVAEPCADGYKGLNSACRRYYGVDQGDGAPLCGVNDTTQILAADGVLDTCWRSRAASTSCAKPRRSARPMTSGV